MSDPETGGRPLASSLQHPEASSQSPSPQRKRRRASQSSDERVGGTKSSSSRRRPGTRKETLFAGPHAGSSRGESSAMQRSNSPTQMSPESAAVHYTRTGRISKAKKGLKVHNCECGRSYTRAEHLRRHQKNHAQDALRCEFPGCGKPFYRLDLLQRHQERHNEVGGQDSPQPSIFSPGSTAESEAQVSAPVSIPPPLVTTLPPATPYYPPSESPLPGSAANASHLNKHRSSFSVRQNSATIPVPTVDGLQTNIAWNDPFSQSPNYSSSSGYASPIPGTGDFTNMFANPPYGPGSNRTRTSSNASFIEPWGYPSRSPTSATSTMAYTWTSNDKSPAQPTLAYLPTSFPMTSMPMTTEVNPMLGVGSHFGPKSMAQRDQDEQVYLFPESSYGMGQITHTYPFEQYLDNYWRHFHPTVPVVHRATFEGMNQQPPMLHAAMIAIGGQYSNDASVKRKSRILHDRCMKLLDKRDLDVMTEPERLCDWQALFLIEVMSQYRARRAAKTLSSRFETMYHKFCESFRIVTANMVDNVSALVQIENATYDRWHQWIELGTQQRLLLCCYILECQQATLLGRNPHQSLIPFPGTELPFPAHLSLWEATNPSDWAMAAQQYAHDPTFIYQVTPDMTGMTFDSFQSSLLIATHYNHFHNPTPYLAPPLFVAIDHLLDSSPVTQHQLNTAKLLQVTPIRALLAVSGESWILSEKVPSRQAFSSYKATLTTWVNALWTNATDPHSQPVRDALKFSLQILQHATTLPPHTIRLELGADMGLYFAALTIWAVTVAANVRFNAPQTQTQPHRFQSHSPLPSTHNYPSTPTHLSVDTPTTSPNPAHPRSLGLFPNPHASPALSHATATSMSPSDITINSINFVNNALVELELLDIIPQWPQNVAQWQQGCGALMHWVKMRLRNGSLEGRDSVVGPTSAGPGRGGDGLGELLDGVTGVLEKIMGRGFDGWGV